jgi:menaquinone-9 beta-reductase
MHDLIIIGGGPAGTAAAITVARSGADVLLLERGKLPRQKVCGEFVSAESLGLLSSLLSTHPESLAMLETAPRIPGGRLFVDGRHVEAPLDPPAAGISRQDLDAALWRAAESDGADARQEIIVQNIEGRGPFLLTTSAGSFESRSVINASGRWSNLRARESQNGNGGTAKWIGIKAHFHEHCAPSSVDLYFFEGGYCGVTPVGAGRENGSGSVIDVCAMVRSDVASTLTGVLECHPSLHQRSQSWSQAGDVVATSPLIFSSPRPVRDGVLQAGDSAGFVDPFVGDGISLALRSGAMAGDALRGFFQGQTSLEQASQGYEQGYHRRLLPVFRTSSKIRWLFGLPAPVRAGLLFVFQNTPALTRYLVKKTRQPRADYDAAIKG